ncbi:hypothetical protein C8R46DRAFT_422392 [Mycena filopes]|nr:hypothetical protein C8R46DRAFT_422392 [Mycena filopes]
MHDLRPSKKPRQANNGSGQPNNLKTAHRIYKLQIAKRPLTQTKDQARTYANLLLSLPDTPPASFSHAAPPSPSDAVDAKPPSSSRATESGISGANLSAIVAGWEPFTSDESGVSTDLMEPISLRTRAPRVSGKTGVPGSRIASTGTRRRSTSSPEIRSQSMSPEAPTRRGGGKVGLPGAPLASLRQTGSPNRPRRSTGLLAAPISLKRKAASADHAQDPFSPPLGPSASASARSTSSNSPSSPPSSFVHPTALRTPLTPRNRDLHMLFPKLLPDPGSPRKSPQHS